MVVAIFTDISLTHLSYQTVFTLSTISVQVSGICLVSMPMQYRTVVGEPLIPLSLSTIGIMDNCRRGNAPLYLKIIT